MRKVNLQTQAYRSRRSRSSPKTTSTVAVDAVAYFRVKDPVASVLKIQNWFMPRSLSRRRRCGRSSAVTSSTSCSANADRINTELKTALDEQTEAWGVQVDLVEVRDVGLPEQMQRAMARQAEAERERRAKVIAADGEFQASEKLAQAAQAMVEKPRRDAASHAADHGRDRDRTEFDDHLSDSGRDPEHLSRARRTVSVPQIVTPGTRGAVRGRSERSRTRV